MTTKVQQAWGILSGKVLLPFSIRSTRKQATYDHVNNHRGSHWNEFKAKGYSATKVSIGYDVP